MNMNFRKGIIIELFRAGATALIVTAVAWATPAAAYETFLVGGRHYMFEVIDTPTPGATTVQQVSGINNNGVIVGTFRGANNTFGFVEGPGTPFKQISYGDFTELLKINDSNQAVGNSLRGAFTTTVPSGSFTPIPIPSGFSDLTVAGISNQNVMVGEVTPIGAPFTTKGFVQGGGLPFTPFSPGNSGSSEFPNTNGVHPHSIASSHDMLIVGSIEQLGGAGGAFIAQGNPNSDNVYTNISRDLNLAFQGMGIPSGPAEAWGVNSSGVIVGSFNPRSSRGFMDEANGFTVIDAPNSHSTKVFDINDKGQIVGGFEDQQANVHGFLMTPLDTRFVGLSPVNPLLPSSTLAHAFTFQNPAPGLWFDSGSLANGFTYSLTGDGTFIEVAPPLDSFGFGPVEVVVGESIVGTLNPGEKFFFEPGVTHFSLMGISTDGNPTTFPTYLNFTGTATSLTISVVPEPSSWVLLSIGLIGLFGYCWRPKREGSVSLA